MLQESVDRFTAITWIGTTTPFRSPRGKSCSRCRWNKRLSTFFAGLLSEQVAVGPHVHHSEPYCFACTRQHLDAIFGGPSALGGLRAIAVMQRLAGHPGVAVRAATTSATNVLLITLEHTPEGLFRHLERRFRGSSLIVGGARS